MNVLFRRLDGSFVADINGLPYHVTAEEPALYALALQHGLSAPFEPAPQPPTPEELVANYTAAIERHVEDQARSMGYSSALSLATHVASTVPAWKAEAEAFVAWRDAVWVSALAQLEAAQQTQTVPDLEDVIASLPVMGGL